MLGAIAGDMIGSVYEFANHKSKEFPLFTAQTSFTDDTILSVAVADVLLNGGDYIQAFKRYYQRYPHPCGGYGARFGTWAASSDAAPYYSWGNGSAMRVSPVGYAFDELDSVLAAAEQSAAVTHNHPEGIKGAQATAIAIFWARQGKAKRDIKSGIESRFGYDLSRPLDKIRPGYTFSESCQETVPEAIIAFLESTDFEDAIRNAVSLGGDADTLTCITGGIAEAFYGGVPEPIASQVWQRLDPPLRQMTAAFRDRYSLP
ncbi:ADP-ribosylglycohydrolase family protein [Romeria aff. gracilis LEGE 07310]|uniref:ADP-ribosylglycohydrolase family protein n=1 Tax=Vasconcelosia minhoensis LEGE 07310 TaxID=915328 RepID=A0A8J7DD62_9CYAN|nr:ADP-ribosylglycohydrolase family protein [Romeria aff. gracilis LEGE 07310]